jgi:hypothetical protein
MKVYISGPISGHDYEERKKEFKRVQEMLEANGFETFNPMENGLPKDATTQQHMKADLKALLDCDAIYMMRKWNHTAGCWTEFSNATAIGLEFMFEKYEAVPLAYFVPANPNCPGKVAETIKFV